MEGALQGMMNGEGIHTRETDRHSGGSRIKSAITKTDDEIAIRNKKLWDSRDWSW